MKNVFLGEYVKQLTLMLAKIKKQLKSTISCLSMCVSILRKP